MADALVIAYLTGSYPRSTDTFIRREVHELRRRGCSVSTFSVRRPADRELVDEAIRTEAASTTYLLHGGVLPLIAAAVLALLSRPGRFLATLWLNWKTGSAGVTARFKQAAYLLEASRLAREIRRRGIQHLHVHMGDSPATVGMLAAQLAGVPYSMTIHGPAIFFAPRQWALGEKVARSAFTACISDFARSQCMIFTPPAHWHKLAIVRCGLDDHFLAAEPTPVPDRPHLVTVGRLCPEKGQALLVQAAARLAARGVDFTLELVGDGESRADLEALIAKTVLGGRVTITGYLGSDKVREKIRAARALVLASFAEGLPVVLMEALALGRPVVSTHIAGIPELVRPGQTGWLVPPSNIDALVDALQAVLGESPEALTPLGHKGVEVVRQAHNIKTEVEKLLGLMRAAGSRQSVVS